MTGLSPAAALATRIAAHEAAVAHAGALEKEHLFIGILSLDKVLKKDEGNRGGSSSVAKEHAAISRLLEITGLDATVLRRLMREALGTGVHDLPETAIHRSPECRKIFDRAAVLAEGKPAGCIHLFSAIMENPGTLIGDVLSESRRCRAAGRMTDVLLPQRTDSPLASRSCAGMPDLIRKLQEETVSTRDLLSMLPAGSQEYPVVQKALVRQLAGLALLCLNAGDLSMLVTALRDLAQAEPEYRDALVKERTILQQVPEKYGEIPPEAADRIRSLLLALGEPCGQEQN